MKAAIAFAAILASLFAPAAQAELQLFLEASPGPLLPGEPLTQMITVRNGGSSALANVSVAVQQPASTNNYPVLAPGASCPGGSCTANEFATWTFSTLAVGQSRTVYMVAIVQQAAVPGTVLGLTATASSSGASPVTDAGTVDIGGATKPLRLAVTTDRETVEADGVLTYTLRYANASLSAADPQVSALVLDAGIPAGTTLVAADGASINGNSLHWDIGAVATRSSGVEHFTVRVGLPATVDRLVADAVLHDDAGRQANSRRITPVGASSPLQLSFQSSASPALPGEPITQTLTVRNAGMTALSNVTLQMQQPFGTNNYPQLSAGAACPGGSCTANEFATWALATLPPGQSRSVQMTAVVANPAAGNRLELHALAGADGISDAAAHDFALVGFEDKPLRIAMVADATSVQPEDILTYTVHYANASLSAGDPQVTGLVLEASLPGATTLVSAPGAVTTPVGTLRWDLGEMPSRSAGIRRFTVHVDSDVDTARLVSEAWLVDNNRRLALVRRTTPVGATASPLRLTVNASAGPALSGEPFTQRLTLRNTGASTLESVAVQLQQPAYTANYPQIVPAASCPGGSCTATEFAIWSVGTLAAGQSRSLSLAGSFASSASAAPAGSPIELHAIASATAISDAVAENVVDSGFSDQPLRVAVTTSDEHVAPGEMLTYSVHVANSSRNATDPQVGALVLEAAIPRGATVVAQDGASTTADGTLRWDLGAQPARADQMRQFSVVADSPAAVEELRTQVWLSDENHRLAVADLATPVVAASPLRVFLNAASAAAIADVPLAQTVTVLNAGASSLESVTVSLQQPAYTRNYPPMAPDGASCPGGSCTPTEFATWSLGTLASGQSRTVDMTALVASTPPQFGIDLNALATAIATNSATAHDVVRAGSGDNPLRLVVETDRQSVQSGDVLTYTLNFINAGSAAIAPLALDMQVPPGTNLLDADAGATLDEDRLHWDFATLGPKSSGTRRYSLRVDSPAGVESLVAEARLHDATGHLASARKTVPVAAPSPLRIVLDATPGPVAAGDLIVLSATVYNEGTGVLEDVHLLLQQPTWTNNYPVLTEGATCPGGSCTPTEYATWSLGNLAAGESRTFSMTATVSGVNGAPPEGTVIAFDALATALVTTTAHATGHVVAGTTIVYPPLGDSIFADGFEGD